QELHDIVTKIRSVSDDRVQEDDKVIAHFLIRLIELHENQKKKEKDVRDFVEVCNEYFAELDLSRKKVIYDDRNFKLFIRLLNGMPLARGEEEAENIKMGMLSFGEKQIVSLFAQIYLSESSSYFLIIDEPELSLSVPWQKRLLPDILRSKRCNGFVAVTHS